MFNNNNKKKKHLKVVKWFTVELQWLDHRWLGCHGCFTLVLESLGWLVDFGFNGPLRQYFSLYRAVSQREGEKGKKG